MEKQNGKRKYWEKIKILFDFLPGKEQIKNTQFFSLKKAYFGHFKSDLSD